MAKGKNRLKLFGALNWVGFFFVPTDYNKIIVSQNLYHSTWFMEPCCCGQLDLTAIDTAGKIPFVVFVRIRTGLPSACSAEIGWVLRVTVGVQWFFTLLCLKEFH